MELLIHPTHLPARFSFTTLKKPNRAIPSKPNSIKFPLHPPFSLNRPLSSSSRFRFSAHFGGPTSRRNYLRKKLTRHKQVSEISHIPGQLSENVNADAFASQPSSFSGKGTNLLDSNSGVIIDDVTEPTGDVIESKSKSFGDSVLWSKLETWVDQYKKDAEVWGIGTGPIFTVFRDSNGNVERVVVNKDEILKRSRVDSALYKEGDAVGLAEVNSKILLAEKMAGEMEKGNDVLPGNSSVVKYVSSDGKSRYMNFVMELVAKPISFRKLSRIAVVVVFGYFVFSIIKGFLTGESNDSKGITRLEKEMLRRKIKARMNKEKNTKGSVEVIEDSEKTGIVPSKPPQLDKEELMANIIKAKGEKSAVGVPATVASQDKSSAHINKKIQEIRAMARQARELEKRESLKETNDGEDDQVLNKLSKEKEMIQKLTLVSRTSERELPAGFKGGDKDKSGVTSSTKNSQDHISLTELDSVGKGTTETGKTTKMSVQDDAGSPGRDSAAKTLVMKSSDAIKIREQSEPAISPVKRRFRVMQSVKEAREYLSKKHDEVKSEATTSEQFNPDLTETLVGTSERLDPNSYNTSDPLTKIRSETSAHVPESSSKKAENFPGIVRKPDSTEVRAEQIVDFGTSRTPETDSSFIELLKESDQDIEKSQAMRDLRKLSVADSDSFSSQITGEDFKLEEDQAASKRQNFEGGANSQMNGSSFSEESIDRVSELGLSGHRDNWIEKNFHELEPVVEKIGVGFRDNFMVAKEKMDQDMSSQMQMLQLVSDSNSNELEWMKDERLREIVFRVRDNELAGRDPFHSMSEEDKLAFFDGLEKKVEQENAKLQNLHKWLHSNIENLDYGTDGISVYDPPEKVIPRWKGPPVEQIRQLLTSPMEQHKAPSDLTMHPEKDYLSLHQGTEPASSQRLSITSSNLDPSTQDRSKPSVTPKTVIEGSDGSIRAGKKSGKEFWQHTKRWSRGFLESYNAETDPEIKSVMKDMGKDLDRWITEKEIQEAADLMDKLPEKGQKFIKEKLDRVKREMELFGPHAVVSKYREYADEKEEDYLWWLDLPFVLCIEMYTEKDGENQVGLYSLEMAADLELDPKQYHVIAFENAGDCKNMCYIIQSHLEMLGTGNAFVVAQRPKDAFREAKANGFGVTVIRKGELQLNVDQALEDVEELITEIGSKVYHDKIMKGRSLDVSSVMKGVFGIKKPVRRRRPKKKLKKPA